MFSALYVFLSHLWEKEEWGGKKRTEGRKEGIEKERKEGSRNKERSGEDKKEVFNKKLKQQNK